MAERRKSHYPLASDGAYLTALQQQSAQVLADRRGHRVFELVDAAAVTALASSSSDVIGLADRVALEQFLDLIVWLDRFDHIVRTA